MPIVDLQRRMAEVGRIRLGIQAESRSGKKHPAALDTFRLTSRDRARIEEAAGKYGGTVTKWEGPSGLPEWEVITKADRLPVIVPPSAMAFSQNYELWAAGGCKRRCTGAVEPDVDWERAESISGGPCLCDPENRQCEPHTRLSVMMKDLKGLGVWRVDTTGYYAALEIKGQVETLEFFAGQGTPLPAILRLDHRVIKREGEPVKRFVVPVLDVDVSPGELLMGTVAVEPPKQQPALTPVPDMAGRPASIADQVKASEAIESRRRAQPIKATGIAPRTAAQRDEAAGYRDPWDAAVAQQQIREDERAEQREAIGPSADAADNDPRQLPDRCPNCQSVTVGYIAEKGEATWRCRDCNITDLEAYDRGLGGWRVTKDEQGSHVGGWRGKEQTEEEAYDAIDRAREAEQSTQDPPRMVTHGQLTALGTILGKRGYNDRSDAGVRARLDHCMQLVRQLMPDNPWRNRSISSSKQLTFDEASALIKFFKAEEKQTEQSPNEVAQQPDSPNVNTDVESCEESSGQPVDEAVNNTDQDVDYYERMEQEESNKLAADPDQIALL